MVIVALLLGAFAPRAATGKPREWVKLTECHYVDAADNDGDSFRVHGGDKDFTARLYYVDAPETNLRQGDRTRDQVCLTLIVRTWEPDAKRAFRPASAAKDLSARRQRRWNGTVPAIGPES